MQAEQFATTSGSLPLSAAIEQAVLEKRELLQQDG